MDPMRVRQHRAAALIATAQAETQQGHTDKALQAAERAVHLMPSWPPAVITLARQQAKAGHKRAARRTVERGWAQTPHPHLAAVFRTGGDADPMEVYRRIGHLCRGSEDQPLSRLMLAEAALEADVWGEARRHLLALTGHRAATQGAYRLLARLERRESGNEQAALQWLTRAIDAPPDPSWLCHACGGAHEEWQALCRHCGAFDALGWQIPGHSREQGLGNLIQGAAAGELISP
jgi:HemY protein